MPAFGDGKTLTQQEIANIEAYLLRLNGVDRAELAHPGLAPDRFFRIVVVAFAVAGGVLGAFWIRARRRAVRGEGR